MARAMPNTPGQIGDRRDGVDRGRAQRLFTDADVGGARALGALGKEIYVEEELRGHVHVYSLHFPTGHGPGVPGVPRCGAFTPFASIRLRSFEESGPKSSDRDGRRSKKASRAKSQQFLVHQTILGSVKYAMESGEHPAVLKNSVTSRWYNASAIYELEKGNFRTVVQDAIWACYPLLWRWAGLD